MGNSLPSSLTALMQRFLASNTTFLFNSKSPRQFSTSMGRNIIYNRLIATVREAIAIAGAKIGITDSPY